MGARVSPTAWLEIRRRDESMSKAKSRAWSTWVAKRVAPTDARYDACLGRPPRRLRWPLTLRVAHLRAGQWPGRVGSSTMRTCEGKIRGAARVGTERSQSLLRERDSGGGAPSRCASATHVWHPARRRRPSLGRAFLAPRGRSFADEQVSVWRRRRSALARRRRRIHCSRVRSLGGGPSRRASFRDSSGALGRVRPTYSKCFTYN